MIKVKCYVGGCKTPHFLIPPPNTRTSIVYAKEVNQEGSGGGLKGTGSSGQTVQVSGMMENNSETSTDSELEKISKEIIKLSKYGITTTQETEYNDYLVVYCDSGHKNIIPFKK